MSETEHICPSYALLPFRPVALSVRFLTSHSLPRGPVTKRAGFMLELNSSSLEEEKRGQARSWWKKE